MHYRMFHGSTGTPGSWKRVRSSSSHDVVDNGDGTASIAIDVDDLSSELIEDAYEDETSKNTNYGSSTTLEAELSSNKEKIPLPIVFDAIGMHSNATILDAH